MEKLSYKLPVFEGPLDLLLHLLAKHKLEICDIAIAQVLEQYLAHVAEMQQQNMEVASEFLTMAARLVHMKTVALLPKHEELEELQEELTGQLLDYQVCKTMAALLRERLDLGSFVRVQMQLPKDVTFCGEITPEQLQRAYQNAVGRGKRFLPPPTEAFEALVARPTVTVASRMIHVLRCLWKDREVAYEQVFAKAESRPELVATFLAVLELVKGRRVAVRDENGDSTLVLLDGGDRKWKRSRES